MRFLLLFLLFSSQLFAQDFFKEEVKEVQQQAKNQWDSSKPTIIFTGSSSVRLWKDLQERFPDKPILNTGFGGSQAFDLEYYLKDLVLDFNPTQVFIYEGDNDISSKQRPKRIEATFRNIIDRLLKQNPKMDIVLISPKPSIARWKLRSRYKRLNKRLNKLALETQNVRFADIWSPMLDKRKPKPHIFVGDGLHMNQDGYEIWYHVLKDYVNTNTQ